MLDGGFSLNPYFLLFSQRAEISTPPNRRCFHDWLKQLQFSVAWTIFYNRSLNLDGTRVRGLIVDFIKPWRFQFLYLVVDVHRLHSLLIIFFENFNSLTAVVIGFS